MKELEQKLLDISHNKEYLNEVDINNLASSFNVSYDEVFNLAKGLDIDIISKTDILSDLKKIELDTNLKQTNHPLLSKEEEIQLFKRLEFLKNENKKLDLTNPDDMKLYKRYKKEIDSIKMKIIDVNTPLVKFIVKKFNAYNLQYDDMIQEGKLGMNQAIEAYDYNINARFTTYAYYKVYQAIKRLIQNHDRSIRVPVHVAELISKIVKCKDTLTNKLGHTPSNEEIAKELNIKVSEVDFGLNQHSTILSLDNTIDEDDKTALSDVIFDALALSPYETSVNKYAYNELIKALDKCNEKERQIFVMRYGLFDEKPATLEELGHKFNLSKERIRQIVEATKRKISKFAPHLKDYVSGGKNGK